VPSNPRHTPAQPTAFARKKFCFSDTIRLHAVAMAVVLGTGLAHTGDAMALALGRIVVQSALGEPLRAEIEVPVEITPEEASSLRVALAKPAAFTAAGLQFNQVLGSAQLTLQRRPDGRAYLRLSSPRPVNEPFLDVMIVASWASGRIVRDYTLLIDPPLPRAAAPVAPLPVRPPATASAQTLPPAVASAAAERSSQVNVRAGDTAGRIALANRPANVSLDQMLVAMLRTNPDAFIGNNVNRIKAGAVIDLPSESAASAVAAAEARQIIAAQSRDFDDFRRRLAGRVPTAAVDTGGREATGQVQAEVQEPKPAAPTQDKLTLSKGATPGIPTSAEDKIAQERQANSASTRVAELARNVDELAKLGIPTPTADPGAPAPTAANGDASGATVTAPTAVPVPVSEETPPTAPALSEPDVVSPSAEPTAPAPAPMSAPTAEEPSLLGQLQENPLVLPAAAGLLVLLAGLGFYRMRQRKKNTAADSSFLESRLQPDSFFGSSGGQRIDTAESSTSSSSMVYSPSQLDAAGDVDPVAEADVYLAYGRDLQAEEILKEAMRSTPTRVAIHNKLLEIYAKRRDAKAFEVVANEAYSLADGRGPEWDHACALGRELDPNNPLYQPGGAPANQRAALSAVAAGGMLTQPFDDSALSRGDDIPAADGGLDLDLDLDFSTDDLPASLPHAPAGGAISALDDLGSTDALTQPPPIDLAALDSSLMDFDLAFPSEPAPLQSDQDRAPMPSPSTSDETLRPMDFDLDFLSEPAPLPSEQTRASMPSPPESDQPMFHLDDSPPDVNFDKPLTSPAAAAAEVQPDLNLPALASKPDQQRPFDLSEINFDFDTPASPASDDADLTEEDPLDTKLSLAEEFRAIGDMEGARSLAEEVLAQASGTLKRKADTFLAELG
jgi:pilus assembly protein FimV